jgi:hypothetical protein
LFLVSTALTQSPFISDSPYYCADVVKVLNHRAPASGLWESGHILWRPLAYVSSPLFFGLIPDRVAWTPILKICYGLTLINLMCGLVSTMLVYDLCRRLMGNGLVALIPALLFVWGDAVLAYSQSGASYIAGLAILILGIWWQVTSRSTGAAATLGPPVLFGVAALFWLPYSIAIPAACCARRFVPIPGEKGPRMTWGQIFASAFAAGAVMVAGVGAAALLAGAHSLPQGLSWLTAAGHGMRQNRQAIRAISGCSRLFFDLGADGVYLKRFLFHDPYHPVSAAGLIRQSLWKVAFFYIFVACVILLTWRSKTGRRTLAPLALATALALVAAILVFEPSSPERFLPVLPFLLLSTAAGWDSRWRLARFPRMAVCLFAVLLPAANFPSFVGASSRVHQQLVTQLTEFRGSATPGDAVISVTMAEPLEQLIQRPFDPLNRAGELHTLWAVDVMSGAAGAQWASRVARFALASWDNGEAVWVEKAALAGAPADRLLWVEGDNPNVHWRDVPSFFRTFEFDKDSGGTDGFLRLSRSAGNEARLAGLAKTD